MSNEPNSGDKPPADRFKDIDILIIGAGPAGSTFARILALKGYKVAMIDAGVQFSKRPGTNLKNSFSIQRDLNQFTYFIQGQLHPLSVPTSGSASGGSPGAELDPIMWRPKEGIYNPNRYSDRGPLNPCQKPDRNLDGEAVAFGVGGMMLHWTAATPRHHPVMERYNFSGMTWDENDAHWRELYGEAEQILGTRTDTFEGSIRNRIVREALQEHYRGRLDNCYGVQNLPMAVHLHEKNDEFVFYTGTDRILAPVIDDVSLQHRLEIRPQFRVKKLNTEGGKVHSAVVEDLMNWKSFEVSARKAYVVACGAVQSAQLLWNSDIGTRNDVLGRYIIEHPIAFTQIVLRQELIDAIKQNEKFRDQLEKQRERNRLADEQVGRKGKRSECPGVEVKDPLPIPMNDLPPNIWIPVSEGRPWHCQIHKDAFHYGALPPGIDDRLIVDLRWFCLPNLPQRDNRVVFEPDRYTAFGMPQPTFEYVLDDGERKRMHDMMEDMVGAALALGGFLPGAEPKFMGKGLALHIQGTCRMGIDPKESVVDEDLRVHELENLFVAGNGVIPTANAANPTLTSVALALCAARKI